MKILIFGAGAIGSAFGGFLSGQHDVTFLGRRNYLKRLHRNGLSITGIWGSHTFRNIHYCFDVKELNSEKRYFDLILVTVKSFDTLKAARSITKMIDSHTFILSLQNGLGNLETLHRYLPQKQVLGGRVIFGVERRPQGVKVTVSAEPTAVGETAKKGISPRVKKIVALLNGCGIPAVACADIESLLWKKVVFNCALNPLASLLRKHYGYLGKHDWTRNIMDAVILEVYQVARRKKISLNPQTPEGYRKQFYSMLLPRTYHHHPSMLQDLRAGRKTEIGALNEAVVKTARRYGLRVPVNAELAKLVRVQERAGRLK